MKNNSLNFSFDENPKEKTSISLERHNRSIDELKKILPAISDSVKGLCKESESSLCGPCPKCGGTDRFVYRIDQQRFWCRQCNPGGGDVIDFHAWIEGITIKDLFKKYIPDDLKKSKIIQTYDYIDAKGKLLFQVCRYEPKNFKQRRPDEKGDWIWNLKGIERVLYNFPKVLKADEVIVVEGEKDADNLIKLGFIATTCPMGAKKWTDEYNKALKGKNIVLIQDNDNEGHEHMVKVAESLNGNAASIKLLNLPGLQEKGDVSDYIATFESKDEAGERLSILIDQAEPYEPPKKVTIDNIILSADEFYKIKMPKQQELLFPWLKEDSINLISGWRGAGKTWLALAILDAVSRGVPFGPWECKKSVPCLFLDGEMTIRDDRDRIQNLKLYSARENPLYFYSDAYANSKGLPRANLVNEDWRQMIKNILLTRKVKLWVVDNISSLAPGLDENAKQDWDVINQWLIELRYCGISTILLHHVSKDGRQRGTSAREDQIDTSIMLKTPRDYITEDGARFTLQFDKKRVDTEYLHLLSEREFKLILDENKNHIWTFGNVKAKTKDEILKLLDEGLCQTDIKDSLGVDKAYISRVRKKAIKDGSLSQKNKLTQSGLMTANE